MLSTVTLDLDTLDNSALVALAFQNGLDQYLTEKIGNWDDCELTEEAWEFLNARGIGH